MTSLAQDLSDIARRGFAWWTGELASLVPKWWREGGRQADSGIVIAVQQGQLSFVKNGSRGANTGHETLSEQALLDNLARRGRPGVPVAVRLRLPHAACLTRRIEIPERAKTEAGRILALDFERATPLSAAEVYTAHYQDSAPAAKGSTGFVQLIVKKATLDGAIARLETVGATVTAADCWSEDGAAVLPVNFLEHSPVNTRTGQASGPGMARVLAGAALVLAMSSIWISIDRQNSALGELESQTEAARAELSGLEKVRGTADTMAKEGDAVGALKADRPMAVQMLDELTRLLPDSTYLTDFSSDDDTVSISGFAQSASELVPVLERSQMFSGAAPGAPVTFDDIRNKERFTYRLRMRQTPRAAPADNGVDGKLISPLEVTP